MRDLIRGAVIAATGSSALALTVSFAHAFQSTQERIGPAAETPRIELEMRAHEQRMQRAQEEHRLNLQIDRDSMRYRPQELRVPQMRRRCPLKLHGSEWVRNCG